MLQQQKLVLGGVSAAAGFQYWKLNITAINSGANVALTLIELKSGGVNQIPAMTSNTAPSPNVITFTAETSNKAFHAVDQNAGTFGWAPSFVNPTFWMINFGAGNKITADTLVLKNHTGTATVSPSDFTLQVSNDGVSFTTVLTVSGQSWSANQTITYTF